MRVDLLSPAFGEPRNVGRLAEEVRAAFLDSELDWNLLFVVNENDPKWTPEATRAITAGSDNITRVCRTEASSYGDAVRAGLRATEGDVVVPIMSDLSDDLGAIPEMVTAIEEGADFVYASRFTDGGSTSGYPPVKMWANRAFNWVAKIVFGLQTGDLSNGFSAYSRDAIETVGVENLESESFDVMIELKLRAEMCGLESAIVPVSWTGRTSGSSKFDVAEQGVRYGRRLFDMLKYRLTAERAGRRS